MLLLGDLVSHDDWDLSEDLKAENNEYVIGQIREKFWGDKDFKTRNGQGPVILPVVGNHEGHPVNRFDYGDPDNFLKTRILSAYEILIGEDKTRQISEKGFYTYNDEQRNIKFISINSNVNSLFNSYSSLYPSNPMNILNNLAESLYESEQKGERVILMTHIPFADDSSQTVFTRFIKILFNRFNKIISCSLAAHTHNDQLKFYKDTDRENVIMEYISPSLTTYTNRNPQYRIYTFSSSGEFKDYSQYKFNIEIMNAYALQGDFRFAYDLSYTFVNEYQITTSDFWSS